MISKLFLALLAMTAFSPAVAADPSPLAFFQGDTVGEGTLSVVLSAPRPVSVDGRGVIDPHGTLHLTQTVRQRDRPVEIRTWMLRDEGGGRYGGTMSDATGPVEARRDGRVLTLRFPGKGGLLTVQTLTLRPDGLTLDNHMDVSAYGLPVATLDEVIVKRR